MRLLSMAQTGEREQALALADEQLGAAESPGFLYVRAIALHSRGDHEGAAHTADRILALTVAGGEPGWRPIALALRAWQHLLLSETNRQASDLESILHDLAQAEVMLTNGVFEAFFAATAHTCLGNGYLELRLYELVRPNYEAAFAAATALTDEVVVDRALGSQLNLATMHLNWSMDVDGLKAVNDAGGHEAGDRTLQAVADALTSQVRAGDLVARLGGDEFVVALEGMDGVAAGETAQRMVDALSAALGSTVTVSVGVATGPAPEAGSSLLRAADRAMYAAKRKRRIVTTGSQTAIE